MKSTDVSLENRIAEARESIASADSVIIGAGAGLSTAAGIDYSGPAFRKEFAEYIRRYGFTETEEEKWAYLSKHVMFARFDPPALPLYKDILSLVSGKNYFVITTNVDGQFRKASFKSSRIFEVQGDYAYIQGVRALDGKRYYAEDLFRKMVAEQKACRIPTELVPRCPGTGEPMDINVRKDQYFVQDESWEKQAEAYSEFLGSARKGRIVLLEFGVGFNTPTIIRFPFEQMAARLPNVTLIRFNKDYPGRQLDGTGSFIPFPELSTQVIESLWR